MAFQRTLFYKFDPSGTTLTYGRFLDEFPLRGFAKTAGASTTTTAVESSGDGATPFDVVTAQVSGVGGDWLRLRSNVGGADTLRNVVTKASSTSITVDSAWDLTSSGKQLTCLPFRFGTGADDGWVMAATTNKVTVKINVLAVGSGSVTVVVEGKMSDTDATPHTIFTAPFDTPDTDVVTISVPWTFLRVGVSETSGSGTDSISAYLVSEDVVELELP
jgi:hypothetical protein